jgi:serine/threonine-protein kinase HipA
MMPDVATLDVELHGKTIGALTRLPDDRVLLAFTQDYIDDDRRATLSLSFKDIFGGLDAETKPTKTRVPPFFSNLLPEGHLRRYLAERAGVNPKREFFLLWVLGDDLPGAIRIAPADGQGWPPDAIATPDDAVAGEPPLRFSLAGVQLKFSAVKDTRGGLTIPANGVGGSWIAKLPSDTHRDVPQNEFSMMELARRVGIDVPETSLVDLSEIRGVPPDLTGADSKAFVARRFDRLDDGTRVHIEDFAQVFGLYPERKYERASYETIARVLVAEAGERGIVEFVRRFVFNALIGNGDMHLKNWSVIYRDMRAAALAPAYDFVSTVVYIRNEQLALNFAETRSFAGLDLERFERFADRAGLSARLVTETVKDTVSRFHLAWAGRTDLPISGDLESALEAHLRRVPIASVG